MIQRLIALWLLSLAATMTAFAANSVVVSGTDGRPGETVELSVALASDVPAAGFQLSLTLPEGTLYSDGSARSAGRAAEMQASGGVRDGVLNLTLYSLGGQMIAAGEGSVLVFSLKLGDTPLTADMNARALLAADDGANIEVGCSGAVLTVHGAAIKIAQRDYSLGRVALGEVHTVDILVENPGTEPLMLEGLRNAPEGWSLASAAVIEPSATGVATLTYTPVLRGASDAVLRFAGNYLGADAPVIVHSEGFGRNEISLAAEAVKGGDVARVDFNLKNYDEVCGFTIKLILPRGFSYAPGSLAIAADRIDGHGVAATETKREDGSTELTLTAYSLTNRPFRGHDGILASIGVLAASRNGAGITVEQAVLPAVIEGEVADVVSASDGCWLSVSSPVIQVERRQNLGRTPVTLRTAGSFRISNYGSEPLVLSGVDSDSEALIVATGLPISLQPWESAEIAFERTDDARGVFEHCVILHCNDPETPQMSVDMKIDRYSPNELTMATDGADEGMPLEIRLCLDNNDEVEGLQFDLEYDSTIDGAITMAATDRAAGFSADVRKIAPGRARVVLYSLGNCIEAGHGQIFTITMTPEVPCKEGVYHFKATDVVIGGRDLENLHSATVATEVSVPVNYFMLGDINNDREVSVFDLNLMIALLLESENSDVTERAADMNEDGEMSVFDVNLHIQKQINN